MHDGSWGGRLRPCHHVLTNYGTTTFSFMSRPIKEKEVFFKKKQQHPWISPAFPPPSLMPSPCTSNFKAIRIGCGKPYGTPPPVHYSVRKHCSGVWGTHRYVLDRVAQHQTRRSPKTTATPRTGRTSRLEQLPARGAESCRNPHCRSVAAAAGRGLDPVAMLLFVCCCCS